MFSSGSWDLFTFTMSPAEGNSLHTDRGGWCGEQWVQPGIVSPPLEWTAFEENWFFSFVLIHFYGNLMGSAGSSPEVPQGRSFIAIFWRWDAFSSAHFPCFRSFLSLTWSWLELLAVVQFNLLYHACWSFLLTVFVLSILISLPSFSVFVRPKKLPYLQLYQWWGLLELYGFIWHCHVC